MSLSVASYSDVLIKEKQLAKIKELSERAREPGECVLEFSDSATALQEVDNILKNQSE